jgi:hypothetical protein
MSITSILHTDPQKVETQLDTLAGVERRRDERVEVDCQASLFLLPEEAGSIPARIVEISSSGLRIEIGSPLKLGTLVRVDHLDSLNLGEVVWCSRGTVLYSVGIRIEHSLLNLMRIQSQARDFLGDKRRA